MIDSFSSKASSPVFAVQQSLGRKGGLLHRGTLVNLPETHPSCRDLDRYDASWGFPLSHGGIQKWLAYFMEHGWLRGTPMTMDTSICDHVTDVQRFGAAILISWVFHLEIARSEGSMGGVYWRCPRVISFWLYHRPFGHLVCHLCHIF